MSRCTYYIGDTRDVLATLDDSSVDMVMTSPPFLALRSYLPADHPDKHREIGSEPDPATFIDTLLALTADWGRVLAPYGSIVIELGDTYSGGNTRQIEAHDRPQDGGYDKRQRVLGDGHRSGIRNMDDKIQGGGEGWPRAKSLVGIPHLYHLSLAYGRNILTGEASPAGQWIVRNVVAWVRPNPPVGALGDKFRPATSYLTVATRDPRRWFDLDAVRTAPISGEAGAQLSASRSTMGYRGSQSGGNNSIEQPHLVSHPAGAPPLDWWNIPTSPYKGAHYATYPPALCEKPIASMCPREVCVECGEPRRRIVGDAEYINSRTGQPVTTLHYRSGETIDGQGKSVNSAGQGDRAATRTAPTLGWTECECGPAAGYRPGVVLDPFGGSGTTGAVASGMGRDSILIDIDERNAEQARDRIGMFSTIIDTRETT